MRPLSEDELRAIGDALGAGEATELDAVVEWQVGDLAGALVMMTIGLVCGAPFERRNRAVAATAAALLARLNGCRLDLDDEDAVVARLTTLAAGDADGLRAWFAARLIRTRVVTGPTCPGCGMPLRECITAMPAGRFVVPTCGGCGRSLGPPTRPRQLQEV